MKRIDLANSLHALANLGVIIGIAFLVVELSQNNELLELEAKTTMVDNLQVGWQNIASDPELVELFLKDRKDEPLTESEEFRLNAYWMGFLIRLEWEYQHFPDSSYRISSSKRLYDSYGSLRRTWDGEGSGSRAAGKDNFSPKFIAFLDQEIFVTP